MAQAEIAAQRQMIERLQVEAKVERVKVSQTANDIKHYTEEMLLSDPLVAGVPSSENPFKEKTSCLLF